MKDTNFPCPFFPVSKRPEERDQLSSLQKYFISLPQESAIILHLSHQVTTDWDENITNQTMISELYIGGLQEMTSLVINLSYITFPSDRKRRSRKRPKCTVFLSEITFQLCGNRSYARLRNMLKSHHQASLVRHFLRLSFSSWCFHVAILFIMAALGISSW